MKGSHSQGRGWWVAVVLALLLFSAVYVLSAWVSEDAFITFRVIDNLWAGHGLVWNPGERVQVYTHPLWLLIISPFGSTFGGAYWGVLAVSYILLLFSIGLLLLCVGKRAHWAGLWGVVALLWSRAFMDYSSSGLENPLVHVLVLGVALLWIRAKDAPKAPMAMSGLASMLFLARPDAVIIAVPFLAELAVRRRAQWKILLRQFVVGGLPAMLWLAFSVFYYGAAVPNTALAKVGTGLDLVTRATSAWNYLAWTATRDPATLVIIVLGLVASAKGASRELRPFFVAICLWLLYLFYVGADYMGGRFLSALVLLSTVPVLLLLPKLPIKQVAMVSLAYGLLFLPSLLVTWRMPVGFSASAISSSGVADERAFYYEQLGLVPVLKAGTVRHSWFLMGKTLHDRPGIYLRCTVGMVGYAAGPSAYIVDKLALTDPFLARLPAREGARVGHYERAFPDGYLESLVSGENRLTDPMLAALYADVRTTVGGELFSWERFGAIYRLNTAYRGMEPRFDRNALGLPGVPINSLDQFSCFGLHLGGDLTFEVLGNPLRVELVTGISPQ